MLNRSTIVGRNIIKVSMVRYTIYVIFSGAVWKIPPISNDIIIKIFMKFL